MLSTHNSRTPRAFPHTASMASAQLPKSAASKETPKDPKKDPKPKRAPAAGSESEGEDKPAGEGAPKAGDEMEVDGAGDAGDAAEGAAAGAAAAAGAEPAVPASAVAFEALIPRRLESVSGGGWCLRVRFAAAAACKSVVDSSQLLC